MHFGYKFSLGPILATLQIVRHVVFSFLLISKYLKFFLMIYVSAHGLFKCILFNFYIFLNFPNILLLLVSNFFIVIEEQTLMKIHFKFFETCFMA